MTTFIPSFISRSPTGSTINAEDANTSAELKARREQENAFLVEAHNKIAQELASVGQLSGAARRVSTGLIDLKEDLKSGKISMQEFDSRFNELAKASLQIKLEDETNTLLVHMGKDDPRIQQLQALNADLMSDKLSVEECKAKYDEIVKTIDYNTQSKTAVARANILNNLR